MKKVHETVHKNNTEAVIRHRVDWVQLKKAIKRVLLPGKDTAISSDALVERIRPLVDFPLKKGRTNERIRKAITEMVEEDREPIISCYKGYYIAESMSDFIECKDSLQAKSTGIQRRITAYERIMEEWEPPVHKEGLFE